MHPVMSALFMEIFYSMTDRGHWLQQPRPRAIPRARRGCMLQSAKQENEVVRNAALIAAQTCFFQQFGRDTAGSKLPVSETPVGLLLRPRRIEREDPALQTRSANPPGSVWFRCATGDWRYAASRK